MLFWARVVPLLAGAAVGLVLYALGGRVGGRLGGLLAAGVWLTTPYVVGLAHLQSIDVSYALALTALVLVAVRDRERPTTGRASVVGLVLGASLLVRHNAVVVVPAVVALLVLSRRANRPIALRAVGVAALVALTTVWGAHRLVDPTPVGGPPRDRFDGLVAAASSEGPIEKLVLAAPMPPEWEAGFAYLVLTADDRPAYLLGAAWDGARPWFFPLSAAVKLPVTATLAVLGGAVLWWRRRPAGAILPPLVGIGALSAMFLLLQPLNLGLRLAVPILALGAVGAAGLSSVADAARGRVLLGVLAAVQVAAFVVAHPTSLAWTPPPFGDGYRAVTDSSIDFGQALFSLRDEHQRDPFVAASLILPRGLGAPAGIPAIEDVPAAALVGRVAVGATALTARAREDLSWLRAYCPVQVVDGAILVYRFDAEPDTRPGPVTPAAPCPGGVSRR